MAQPREPGDTPRIERDPASLLLAAYFAGLIVLVGVLLGLQALP